MNISSLAPKLTPLDAQSQQVVRQAGDLKNKANEPKDKLRETFDSFVGQTFYGQMLKAMRSTVGKPAYLYGGQAEEAFRGQLDQLLSEKMSEASAGQFTGGMFEQFSESLNQLNRR